MQISISKNAKIKEKMIYSQSEELIIDMLASFLLLFQNSDNMFAIKLSESPKDPSLARLRVKCHINAIAQSDFNYMINDL